MGDFGVVADVSTIIVDRLTEALRGLDPNEPPTAVLSDLEDRPSRATLTVFLYEIAEDPTSRNRPPVRSLPPSAPTSRKPPGSFARALGGGGMGRLSSRSGDLGQRRSRASPGRRGNVLGPRAGRSTRPSPNCASWCARRSRRSWATRTPR